MSVCNKLWSVCAVDATGPVSRDAGEQSAGATPHRRGALLPPRAPAELGKENMVKYAKGVLGGCRWKWTVNKAKWRTAQPEEVHCGVPIGSGMTGAREMWLASERIYRYLYNIYIQVTQEQNRKSMRWNGNVCEKRHRRNRPFTRRGSRRSPTQKCKGGHTRCDSCRCSPA
jgi:hypothetical protein